MAKADPIPLQQKLAYAVGMFVNNLQAAAIPAMLVILNLGLEMDPALVGLISFVPRIFDAASDPIFGYISDNARTRWGRRRPYIFVGALVSGLTFAAMWQLPPGLSERFYFYAFMGMSIFYFVIYTLFATPLVAMGFEMSSDYHERTRLQAVANIAGQIPWVASPWFYAFMASERFDGEADGARVLALGVGGTMCLLGIVPAIFCREKISPALDVDRSQGFALSTEALWSNTRNFFAGINTAFECRPFIKLCVATFLVFNGYQFGAYFTLYVIKYYIFPGDVDKAGELYGTFGTLTAVCSFVVIPLSTWISTKIGKRKTFFVMISLSLVGYALKWVGYNPDYPRLLLVACPFIACGIGSLFTLMSSMVADVCDYDELISQQRREGLFGAIYWWMVKLGLALAGLLFGLALKSSGFDVDLEVPQQEHTLLLLRAFDIAVPLVTSAMAILVVANYEISGARAQEIRYELEQRKSLGANSGD